MYDFIVAKIRNMLLCVIVIYPLLLRTHVFLASHGSVVAALYWQLGWEVGVVSCTLETNGINWGYFIDHDPFEPHCNQHPNNFVILPPVSVTVT